MKLRPICLAALLVGCRHDLGSAPTDAAELDTGAAVADSGADEGNIDSTIDSAVDTETDSGSLPEVDACSDVACSSGMVCTGGACTTPSCAGSPTCSGISCCDAKLIPGGTFLMGRGSTGPEDDACKTWASAFCDSPGDDQPEHSVTVSSFKLDTYEVTVGRFRNFVAAYPTSRPKSGAGAHPSISDTGWRDAWNMHLPLSAGELMARVKCDPTFQTWTDAPGSNENKPINCVDWFTAFAFCAWDGGRLPTEAEWEYAAAGGSENRVLPWGSTPPNNTLASYGCGATFCTAADLRIVGATPLGASRWGQQDLAGNLGEWTFDAFAAYVSTAQTNPAVIETGIRHVRRGGGFAVVAPQLRATARTEMEGRYYDLGVRCARLP